MEEVNRISLKAFTHVFAEAQKCNRRFCFILGSGASREAGIPTGVEMARSWADELKNKYDVKEQKALMKKLNIKSVEPSSENYFGIYDLRFYPDYQEGYAYFERELERGVPSLGHHALAKILTGKVHNLAITTNFDSLIEDALFIYTNKHPLVVGHESLTEFINLNIDRPIVAKIHRSLYFHPFNRKQETDGLAKGWQETLKNAFMVYTPVVIGYAGGDQSLMSFLKDETIRMNGLYWCYWNKEEPSKEIVDLVKSKNGCLVPIEGFDQMMFMLSRKMGFENPEKEMREVTERRIKRYNSQYDEFEKRIREEVEKENSQDELLNDIIEEMNDFNLELLEKADKEKTEESYCLKGRIYTRMGRYEEAVEAFTKAIEMNEEDDDAYSGRGVVYEKMQMYDRALEDYTRAIQLKSDDADTYFFRASLYFELEKYKKALEDYTRAIQLKSDDADTYCLRGCAYCETGEYKKAIQDYSRAIELNSGDADYYYFRACAYDELKQYVKALSDCNKVLGLNHGYKEAYELRAEIYRALGEHDKAEADEQKAESLGENDK